MKRDLFYALILAATVLGGCLEASDNRGKSISLEPFQSVQSIKNYLHTNVASTGFGGKPYCAYEVLDAQQEDDKINLYLWTVCHEYYLEKQKLRQGSSAILPVALVAQINNDALSVLAHRVPRDGALNAEDMSVIFSERFLRKKRRETQSDKNDRIKRLTGEIKREAGVN